MHAYLKKIILAESAATRAPPSASLHRTWKTCLPSPLWAVQRHESHWGARSGEYGRCGRHSKDRSWIVATVEWAALSCWSKTPVLRHPHCLDL